MAIVNNHHAFMQIALNLAGRGLGRTWPNPSVGCVIVANGKIVGRGWTQPGGQPHAEVEALRRAGSQTNGATAYVTLEPCVHQGRTPPCTEALINSGIKKVMISLHDPDPRVNGRGIKALQNAGIKTEIGLCSEEAKKVTAGFLQRVYNSKPFITLKFATTLDGMIATGGGVSEWITGETSRRLGHLLRANHDAVLIGSQTAEKDNPLLTCRLPGMRECSPIRIIVASSLRLPLSHKLIQTALEIPTWFFTVSNSQQDNKISKAYEKAGVKLFIVKPDEKGKPNLLEVVEALGKKGITRLLVEGGGKIASSFLKEALVDEIFWFRAAKIIGGDGVQAISKMGIENIKDTIQVKRLSVEIMGEDVLERYSLKSIRD
ncbi:MAG: bifunctional diaminohydroxyphosphoribosylaminopyrimidine deaminase/5-amino-6-(5-phosphoribosylamino)uracil reductase RibD [Pseudomonadota bacterium]|nr:bifunctional diaminohydroxyphosphoribosylaminopyrimidine deaminase/5-amino-6-(5-phosphoribosylamino)uracil reductase RibD [Pseudomonadota bacterium]